MQNRTNAWKIPSLHDIPCYGCDFRLVTNDYESFCFYFIVLKIVIYKPKKRYGEFFNCNCSN